MGDSAQDEKGTPLMVTTVRAVSFTVALLSLLVCSSRLYLRRFVLGAFGIDDYLVIFALVLVLGFAALSVTITFYGIGRHQDTVPKEKLPTMQLIVYISLCTYLFVATAVKTSLIAFIMRVFPNKIVKQIGYGVIGFLLVLTISGEFPLIFQCDPVRAAYDSTVQDKDCFSGDALFGITMYQGVLMFLVDVVIIALPMPTIWKLQMPAARRNMLLGLFALGTLACVAALIRLPTLVYQNDASDYTYSAANSLIWMNVEFNVGLIVGSLPSLRKLPVLNRFLGSQGQSQQLSSNFLSRSRNDQGSYGMQGLAWDQKVMGRMDNDLGAFGGLESESRERIVEMPKIDHR